MKIKKVKMGHKKWTAPKVKATGSKKAPATGNWRSYVSPKP